MDIHLESSWKTVLDQSLKSSAFDSLTENISAAYHTSTIFPAQEFIFRAFSLCPFKKVHVVILGQDPYHAQGQADGLSFSVPDGTKIPPSLRNIYKEIANDTGLTPPTSGNLSRWASQGVLLLNCTLTVEKSKPGSHQRLGWEIFTDSVIKKISDDKTHVVFLLWGNFARSKKVLIDQNKHLVLEAPHPSPLSAHTGFLGCRHFSQTNTYLKNKNLPEIIW